MNSKLPLVTSLVLGCVLSPVTTHALSLESRFVVHSGLIPDGDPNGRADLRSITGVDGRISDVDVYLRLSGTGPDGGWNGDIFAALRHDSGYAVLLNRPGRGAASEFGSGGDGLDLWLDDEASDGDIHGAPSSSSPWLGTWAPDGRLVGPTDAATALDTAPRSALLSVFDGLPVSGEWSLLVIDASSGGRVELAEWGLRIAYQSPPPTSTVPDAASPLVLAAMGFAMLRALGPSKADPRQGSRRIR